MPAAPVVLRADASGRRHADRARPAGLRRRALDALPRYWPLAWQWAYGITGQRARADDLAQDAVLRAFRSLRTYDVERPFGPWLKRIVLNLASAELRRLRRGEIRTAG
jgi:RNA polymerase sigma factor (sigma-70 family)